VLRDLAIVLLLAVAAAGCGREAGELPMPSQLNAGPGRDPGELGHFIRMGDPNADEYIVKDISPEHADWRWALVRPELKLRVKHTRNLKFTMEFVVPGATMKVTGPVTVTAFINGRTVGSLRCPAEGKYRLEKPVPAGWVEAEKDIVITAEVDKRWVSPDDGAQLSFLLGSVGFSQ
jgi:hypothetical protein